MAYTFEFLKLDIDDIVNLPGYKYEFKSTGLKGKHLIIRDNSIIIGTDEIRIERQKTNFGEKNFFLCPCCLSARKHIYYVNGYWKCRECGNLKYRSTVTYRDGMDYCDLKIDKILDKLKVEHKIEYYTGDLIPYVKPYKMRWKTYSNLIIQLRYWQCERTERWLRFVSLRWPK